MNPRTRGVLAFFALWIPATLIAMFFALLHRDAAFLDGQYIPMGNDSFYHARRVLDGLATGVVAQFDPRIHVPNGAWIPWPWGYDYLLLKTTQVAQWLQSDLDPMAYLSHVPVAWIAVNTALFLGILRAIGLPLGLRAIGMLAFALSALNQQLHVIGMLDHHYVEFTFVLANVLLGVRWLKRPNHAAAAMALGVLLGVAPGFHNGLFILQLPALLCIFIMWLRGNAPPIKSLAYFSIALVVSTSLIVLPAHALHEGMFEFALLSWFHVYVTVCSAICLTYIGLREFSRARFAILSAIGVLLLVPIAAELFRGGAFFAGDISVLSEIAEARSPLALIGHYGFVKLMSFYSYLLVAAPALLLWFGWSVAKETAPPRIFFAAAAVLGLALMLTQFRFHYFGTFALIAGVLVTIDGLCRRMRWGDGGRILVGLLVIAVGYQPSLRHRLFLVYPPSAEPDYANTRVIHADLAKLCDEDPGVVLANHDDGNSILFHSNCSVIANNFILRAEDEVKIDEIAKLMTLPPSVIRDGRPDVKYLFLRAKDFSLTIDGEEQLIMTNAIAKALLSDESPPEGFTLVRSIQKATDDPAPYARLYKISGVGAG